MQKFKEV